MLQIMTTTAFSYATELRPAFLAHMADRLDRLICNQTKELLIVNKVKAPVTCLSIMIFLLKNRSGAISDIARLDGQSHQLIQSRIGPLEKLGLVETRIDAKDSRRRLLILTAEGTRDAKKVEAVSRQVASKLKIMNAELETDLMLLIEKAERYLTRNPLNLDRGQ
ncbi:MAG: hypothetical protein Pars2KO_28930 [Parasphingorhabdus sp.]